MSSRTTVLALLARAVASAPADEPLPARLCRACVSILGADGGAITLSSTRAERLTVSASDGTSARLEDLQDVLGEGPGQEAYRSGSAVVVRVDGARGGPFPMFAELAADVAGPLTIWAIPLHPAGVPVGVVTLYRVAGDLAYGGEDAQFLADAVGAALLDERTHDQAPFAAWSERARVHQAAGMVVAQLAISPNDALAILRAHAFAEGATLDAIAVDVVERRLTFSPTDQDESSEDPPLGDSMGNGQT